MAYALEQVEGMDQLIEAFLALENKEECANFLLDLCTVTELHSMAQRLEVAKRLRHKAIYSDIVAATGASTATISRVNRSLHYGENGYQVLLARLEEGK